MRYGLRMRSSAPSRARLSALFKVAFAASTVALLSACAPVAGLFGGGGPGVQEARCRAAGAEAVVGRTLDARVVSDAILGAGALRSRTLRPGMAATTAGGVDPMRLNIEVDNEGRVRRLSCG
jgi:hypothetical protein